MAKILGGDWPANTNVALKKGFSGQIKTILIQRGIFSFDRYPLGEIKAAELVTAENQMAVGAKLGWGVAGALVLGPIGAAIGGIAGGNRKLSVVAVTFSDGKRALIQGQTAEMTPILGAGYYRSSPSGD